MNENTKSVIRHILTGLGAVLAFFGLGQFTELVEIINTDLDAIWEAIITLTGVVMTIVGFFKDKDRHKAREAGSNAVTNG